MIEFENKLPSMYLNGGNGIYNNPELGFPSVLTTKDARLGMFIKRLRDNICENRSLVFVNGKFLVVNKNWIRDHAHIMKATRHWEYDLSSFLNFILDTQREDGQFYELIKQMDDAHWSYVNEDCRVMYPDDNLALVRLEIEADIEYLVVEAATYFYRTNGDNEWLKKYLPKMEKGINYVTSDPKRWDAERGLVKRPFTIDTWDFVYDTDTFNRRIEKDTPMSVMHGDNSGVYQAMLQLAWFNRRLNREEQAAQWEERAEILRRNMFRYLWNEKFFVHQLHLNHNGADNLESQRLSLSNSYDINRGVTDLEQSRSIVEEYMARRKTTQLFAEWFSIDPPYENFRMTSGGAVSTLQKGQYVNGAVCPFTAGELAKAAFGCGYEEYGWDIISRFVKLMERDHTITFLYYPDSKPQNESGPSAWGAAALLSAVDEGLAGIVDAGVNYDEIEFSPRFVVTEYTELRYFTGYEISKALVEMRFIVKENGMRYDLYSPAKKVTAHILLPKGKTCAAVILNGQNIRYTLNNVADSPYVDFEVSGEKAKRLQTEILF